METAQEMQQIDSKQHMTPNGDEGDSMDVASEREVELISFSGILALNTSEETKIIDTLMTIDDDAPTPEPFDIDKRHIQKRSKATPSMTVDMNEPGSNDNEIERLRKDFERAKSDLKLSNRECRDQSLELRDLKRANAQYHERNAQLRAQNAQLLERLRGRGDKISKSERNKFIEHFEMLEDHIARLQHEAKKRENHTEFLTEQTREANESKAYVEAEMRNSRRQIRDLSTNLTECKDDLLRLQPTSQISDNEIAEAYSNLDQQITAWVDDRTEDADILEYSFNRITTPDGLAYGFLRSSHLRMAKKYPGSQPTLLRYLIHCYLHRFILGEEVYLLGLSSFAENLLRGLEEGMTLLEPRRDTTSIIRWRTETLQALHKTTTFVNDQNLGAENLSQGLQGLLSGFIPPTDPNIDSADGLETLHSQITLPALALATKLRLSTSNYTFTSQLFTNRDPAKSSNVLIYETKDAHMVDIMTHKVIRPDSAIKIAEDGSIGEEMLVVSPALLRVVIEGERKGRVLVAKPNILVKLHEPMMKKAKGMAMGMRAAMLAPGWLVGNNGGGREGEDEDDARGKK